MGLWNNYLRVIFAYLAVFASAELRASSYGLQLDGGGNTVTSSKEYEIKKSGPGFGAMAFIDSDAFGGSWGLGLGLLHVAVDGDVPNRGIRQELKLDLLFIDLRYLYAISESFSAGLNLRGYYGKGADYGVVNTDDVKFLLAPGLVLRYEWMQLDYRPTLSFAYYQAESSSRKIKGFLIGVSASSGLDSTPIAKAEPTVSRPTPLSPSQSEAIAEESKAGEILVLTPPQDDIKPQANVKRKIQDQTLETITFTFKPKSSLLSRESKAQIKKLAKVLVRHAEAWSKISVSGHSDQSGDPDRNKALSQKRAEALCKRLTTRGVPKSKLTCLGEGSSQLLAGIDANAAEQRRIELKFDDYDALKLDAIKMDIDKALQK